MKGVYYGGFHEDPSLIIAIVLDTGCWEKSKHICGKDRKFEVIEAHESIGIAGLNMIYGAHDLGINSCFLTPSQKDISEILKLKKQDSCQLLIGFGYEKKGAFHKERERRPLSELVSYEYFGGKK